jgi:hypothetical protein
MSSRSHFKPPVNAKHSRFVMASRQARDGLLKRRQSFALLAFGATRGAFRLEGVELGAIQNLPGMGGFEMSSSYFLFPRIRAELIGSTRRFMRLPHEISGRVPGIVRAPLSMVRDQRYVRPAKE